MPLLEPRDGLPPVVADGAALAEVVRRFAEGTGPVAVDAERASGYRYGQRAYLVQLRRSGAGTALIDPIAVPDLTALDAALAETEAVFHAASQDLPCLTEVGLRPHRLFDTELAARLLNYPRVGLGIMVETVLGLRLEKGYSAADWSTRPLPEDWLRYAALDVEVLVDLRDALEEQLSESGKLEWAREDFAAIAAAPPPAPRADPWRRTSGIHRVRTRRALAVVRELWTARDHIAADRDTAPGRVLPDAAIVAAATGAPRTAADLGRLQGFSGRGARRHLSAWFRAVSRAQEMPDDDLPEAAVPSDGPPPANRWADREPAAAARLAAARTAIAELGERHDIPVENLLQPDALRRLAWSPPADLTEESVAEFLRGRGARHWQIELTTGPLTAALESAATA
ncbi:MAG TPA: HRDC domain-containing protein [Streptosporangiaceae bacterium]